MRRQAQIKADHDQGESRIEPLMQQMRQNRHAGDGSL